MIAACGDGRLLALSRCGVVARETMRGHGLMPVDRPGRHADEASFEAYLLPDLDVQAVREQGGYIPRVRVAVAV